MRRNRGSKWESDWVRRCDRSQVDQGEVLDDCCQVTFALGTFHSKGHIITSKLLWIATKEKLREIPNIN